MHPITSTGQDFPDIIIMCQTSPNLANKLHALTLRTPHEAVQQQGGWRFLYKEVANIITN